MDKTAGSYFREPVQQKSLLEAMAASLGPHVGDHLLLLQLAPISGILLVITPHASAGPSQPVLTVVTAPSMATIGRIASASDPGLLFEDIWEPSVLSMFPADFDCMTHHWPLLAASSGASRGIYPVMLGRFLVVSCPLFFSTGEVLVDMVGIGLDKAHCLSIFLPEVCSTTVGLIWPTATTFEAFQQSVTVLGKPFMPFLITIHVLAPQL